LYENPDPDTASPIKSILGFDVKVDGGPKPWREAIPLPGDSLDCSSLNSEIHAAWAKLSTAKRNEFDDLKSKLKDHIKSRDTGGVSHMEKGILSTYLEEYYKNKLINCAP
jgi:hypothetical protein